MVEVSFLSYVERCNERVFDKIHHALVHIFPSLEVWTGHNNFSDQRQRTH